jgi:hypothetical protein
MARKTLIYSSLLLCILLVGGCYYGSISISEDSVLTGDLDVAVITESGDAVAYQEEDLLIAWDSGKTGEPLTIELVDGMGNVTPLVESYTGEPPFTWVIPSDFPAGESYRARITFWDAMKGSGTFGESEEFAILESIDYGLTDITVSSRSIDITFTDNGSVVDGDTVTIILNGSVLEANHVLQGPPGVTISVDLLPGINTLSIQALNEGTVSPNTAQISFTNVVDGEAVQEWRLLTGETGSLNIDAP